MTRRGTRNDSGFQLPVSKKSEDGDYRGVLLSLEAPKTSLDDLLSSIQAVFHIKLKNGYRHHIVKVIIDHATYSRLNKESMNGIGGVDLSLRRGIEFVVVKDTTDWFIELE